MKTMLKLIAALLPIVAQAEITDGWLEAVGGTKYFNAPENWANGEVNGLFSSDLAVTGENTISFTNDWTGSLKILSSVDGKINFNSARVKNVSDGNCTLTLNDDLWLTPQTMTADVTFGNSYTAVNYLNFDLGGVARTIHLSGARWIFSNRVTNGDVVFDGTGTFTLRSAAGFDGNVTLCPGLMLATGFTSSDKVDISTTRAKALTLNRSQLTITEQYVNVDNTFTGALKVADANPSCSILNSRATTAGKTQKTTFGSLELAPGALLLARGPKLGNGTDGEYSNVYFETIPETVGGIVPQVVGAKADDSKTTGGLGGLYDGTLVGYDAERGLYPLDLAKDYAKAIPTEDGADPVNLMVPHGETITIEKDTTVNSLFLETVSADTTFATMAATEGATLRVASGMVMIGYPSKSSNYAWPCISAPLDFGSRRGVIVSYAFSKAARIHASIAGSNGLLIAMPRSVTEPNLASGLTFAEGAAESTYTGNTYIQCDVNGGQSNFLPHGSRKGDLYLNAKYTADNFTINGLYGKGTLTRASSNGKTVTLGDNDADGDFTGTIAITDKGGTLTKIGTGTQRFAGTVTLESAVNVNAGMVILDGSVEQGAVNVAAGAKLGGSGVVKTPVAFAEGAKLLVKVEGKTLAAPLTVAAVSGKAIVEADGLWKGEACVLKAAEGATLEGATFVKGENVASLRLSADKTELYASPKAKGFAIVIM